MTGTGDGEIKCKNNDTKYIKDKLFNTEGNTEIWLHVQDVSFYDAKRKRDTHSLV